MKSLKGIRHSTSAQNIGDFQAIWPTSTYQTKTRYGKKDILSIKNCRAVKKKCVDRRSF